MAERVNAMGPVEGLNTEALLFFKQQAFISHFQSHFFKKEGP